MMDAIKGLENGIKKVIAERMAKADKYEKQKKIAALELEKASADMTQADESGNMVEFVSAKKRVDLYSETVKVCQERIDQIMGTPCGSEEEYNQLVSAALDEYRKECGKRRDKVRALVDQIGKYAEEEKAEADHLRSLMREYKENLLKEEYRGDLTPVLPSYHKSLTAYAYYTGKTLNEYQGLL